MKKSALGKLNWKDATKGFVVAVITAVITTVIPMMDKGVLPGIDNLKVAGISGLVAGLSYLIKNVLTNSQDKLLTKEP